MPLYFPILYVELNTKTKPTNISILVEHSQKKVANCNWLKRISVNKIKEWNKKWAISNCRLHTVDYYEFCRIQEFYDPVTNKLRSFVDLAFFNLFMCLQ